MNPSDVTTVDLEAIASTLLAEVQIDDNTSSLHDHMFIELYNNGSEHY